MVVVPSTIVIRTRRVIKVIRKREKVNLATRNRLTRARNPLIKREVVVTRKEEAEKELAVRIPGDGVHLRS